MTRKKDKLKEPQCHTCFTYNCKDIVRVVGDEPVIREDGSETTREIRENWCCLCWNKHHSQRQSLCSTCKTLTEKFKGQRQPTMKPFKEWKPPRGRPKPKAERQPSDGYMDDFF